MKIFNTPAKLIIAFIAVAVVTALITYNLNTIKGWFSPGILTPIRATAACYKCCTTDGISCPNCDCKTSSPK